MNVAEMVLRGKDDLDGVYSAGYNKGVNKYFPPFEESGTAVRCEPVEDYPLQVVSNLDANEDGYTEASFKHGGKNIFDPEEYFKHSLGGERVTLDGDVFTCNFINGAVCINNSQNNRLLTQPGTYTLRISPVSEDCHLTAFLYKGGLTANRITYKNLSTDSGVLTMSFTVADEFAIAIGGTNGKEGTYSFRVQLEVGSVATEYEPFVKPEEHSVSFPQIPGGTFDWGTGILTDLDGNVHHVAAHDIVGKPGVNTFISGAGTIKVSGKTNNIYAAGQKAEYDRFWNAYQQNGNATDYQYAFAGSRWNAETFKPKYDLKPTNAWRMFYYATYNGDLQDLLEDADVKLDTSNATDFREMFYWTYITRIGKIDMSKATNTTSCFQWSDLCVTIEEIIVSATTPFNNTFANCKKLANLVIKGTIGQNGFNVADCPLTYKSLKSIVDALQENPTITQPTVRLGATNLAKLEATEEGMNAIAEATRRGWTIG